MDVRDIQNAADKIERLEAAVKTLELPEGLALRLIPHNDSPDIILSNNDIAALKETMRNILDGETQLAIRKLKELVGLKRGE